MRTKARRSPQADTLRAKKRCAYCGGSENLSGDHVVSRGLYPDLKVPPRDARVTVPACVSCNNGWSKDEAFCRNVLAISGEPSVAVRELWEGKIRRGFAQADGKKQARDLFEQMVKVESLGDDRYMIFPARSERVLRIVRKIVRGLCHHHGLLSSVTDIQVWADIQRFEVPPEFLSELFYGHADEDVLSYAYGVLGEPEIHSFWTLTFYKRTPFHCFVFQSPEARARFEAGLP